MRNQLRDVLTQLLTWLIVGGCLYLWVIEGYVGAGNVFVFYTWTIFALASLVWLASLVTAVAKKPHPPEPDSGFPSWVRLLMNATIILPLAWYGHTGLAAVSLSTMLLARHARIIRQGAST